MKKVVILTDTISTYGGIQRCVCMLANELVEKKYEVNIICIDDINKENKLYNLATSVKVHYSKKISLFNKIVFSFVKVLEKIDDKFHLFKDMPKLQNFIYIKSRYSRNKNIINIINRIDPENVIAAGGNHSMMIGSYSNKIKAKKIGWQHSSCESYFKNNFKNMTKLYIKCIKKLDEYVVLTEYDKKWLEKNINYKATTIYNFKSFSSNNVSKLNNKRMISVGRLADAKNYELTIEAFSEFSKKNKEWILDIYGTGAKYEELQSLIKKLKLEKKVILNEPVKDIKKEYLNSSLFIISSKVEGFGLVVIEAMECGLPIIATNLPCFRELISENEGIILEDNKIEKLANAMNIIVNDSNRMKKLSINAKLKSKNFSNEVIIEKWVSILR